MENEIEDSLIVFRVIIWQVISILQERNIKTLKEGIDNGIDKKGICENVKAECSNWIEYERSIMSAITF